MRDENFELGKDVFCGEKACGRLTALTVTIATARLTLLIVEPYHGGEPRLVLAREAHATPDGLKLDCTPRQFDSAEPAAITHIDPSEAASYVDAELHRRRHKEPSSWIEDVPCPAVPAPDDGAPVRQPVPTPQVASEAVVPAGDLRIDRGTVVHFVGGDGDGDSDGDVGPVAGVTVDARDKHLVAVLVDVGSLWRHRRVAIPMARVRGFDARGITVLLSKSQIKDLVSAGGRHR